MNERADVERIGAAIRTRRRELGLTQQQVADLAGVSTRFVHSVEHGKPTVQLVSVIAVASVLGLRLEVTAAGSAPETDS